MYQPLLTILLISTLASCSPHEIPRASTSSKHVSDKVTRPPGGEVVTELDKNVLHIFQASDSSYWFGSDGHGVYRFDGKELLRFTTEHGLPSNRVRGIQEDRSGAIFVSSEPGGVSRFDGREFHRLTALDPSTNEWKLETSDLWFSGGQDSGVLYRWDGTSLHRLAFPKTEAGEAHIAAYPRSQFPNATYSPYDVYTVFKDSREHLWFGTSTLGACHYDGTSFVWTGHGENGGFGVRSIVEEKDGTFWLSNTVSRFVEDTNTDHERPRYRKQRGIATEADPYSVFISNVRDKDGVLWLATLSNGVFRYDGSNWTHYPVTHDGKTIWVFSIYRDREGALWLGTHEHGVYKFNGSTFEKFQP